MNVRLNDKYAITSDKYCYVLNEIKINKKNNEEYYFACGFYNNLENLIKAILELDVKTREVDSLIELKELIEVCARQILEVIKNDE